MGGTGNTTPPTGAAPTSSGQSTLPTQVDFQDLKNRIEDHIKWLLTWMRVIAVCVPIALGLAVYEIKDRDDRISKLEADVTNLYAEQRDAIEERDQRIIEYYDQKLHSGNNKAKMSHK